MKTFLASIESDLNTISILKHSKEIQHFENENMLILFTGQNSLLVNDIAQQYQNREMHFLKELNSSFSLLLYDKLRNKLFIAKDKVGIEPLYFYSLENLIIVGTHLKDFKKVASFTPTINPSSIGEYMQFGSILQPHTIFKDCYKVCAGEYVCFDVDNNTYTSTKYWELEACYDDEKMQKSEAEILKETHTILQESVEKATKNSNFGLSLSGGYDSSTLVAIAQSQSEKKIDTFTIGFHCHEIDEAPHAKAISKHLGTTHHEYYFTAQDALDLIPKMCDVYDEPFADYASSPTMITAQLLKELNLTNIISGDGGDEVFATAEDVHLFEKIKKTPTLLKQLVAQPLSYLPIDKMPYLKNHKNLAKKIEKLQQILQAKNIPKMIEARNTLFLEEELKTQIKDYTKPLKNSFDILNFRGSAQAVDEIIGTYFKTTMADGELIKSYSAMNNLDINLLTPFLNPTLINYMAQVPSSIKIKNGVKKYLLKELAYQYIPKELIERPKAGFSIPFASWMKNELKEILYKQINKKRLDKDNIFYTSYILSIRDQFYLGNDAYKYKLWRIFIFQLWYENFQKNN